MGERPPASGFRLRASGFGFRLSFGLRISDFGFPPHAFRIADISQQGEQAEEAAEHILALGNPGNRFKPQRVQGEQPCHQQAPPPRAGHPLQNREDQRRVERVQ